jgi:hypothetical protein
MWFRLLGQMHCWVALRGMAHCERERRRRLRRLMEWEKGQRN